MLRSEKLCQVAWWFVVLLTTCRIVLSETNWDKIHDICGSSYSDRIVGGTKASMGQVRLILLVFEVHWLMFVPVSMDSASRYLK
jgi:hypothetical protein